MFDPKPDLLIDIGNTRIKYAWCDHLGKLSPVFVLDNHRHANELIQQSATVTAASVNNIDMTKRFETLAKQLKVPYIEITTQPEYQGITCPYEHPNKLGVDRWLCALAIAVQQRCGECAPAVAVIDFGTAANCEFMVAGEYLGGWIAPGFELMRNALVAGTTKVSADERSPQSVEIGTNTEACVNAGCIAMVSGLVRSAKVQLAQHLPDDSLDTEIIATGGTSEALQSLFNAENLPLRIVPDLIFQGMRLFLNQTEKGQAN